MKKHRFSILAKIVLLTGLLTIAIITSSLIVNSYLSYKKTKNDASSSATFFIDLFGTTVSGTTDNKAYLEQVVSVVLEDYEIKRDDYEQMNEEELLEYQQSIRNTAFGSGYGIGLSLDALRRRNYYNDLANNVVDYCKDYNIALAKVVLYDVEKNREINIFSTDYNLDGNFNNIGYAYNAKDNNLNNLISGNSTETIIQSKSYIFLYNMLNIDYPEDANNYLCYVTATYDLNPYNENFKTELISNILITLIGAIVLIGIYTILAKIFLINNIKKLGAATNTFVDNIENNNQLTLVNSNVNSNDEIKDLANKFDIMQEKIIQYIDNIKEAKLTEERINTELSIANKIQLEALPTNCYYDENLELRAFIHPAKEVGGDFYDYFYIDNNHFAFLIADVSGKGVPAAMFMMRAKERIKATSSIERDLNKVFYNVNNELCLNNKENYFITAFLGILDITTNILEFINAGHERPFIVNNGTVKQLNIKPNFVLGLNKNYDYVKEEILLEKGDTIFLHTDGLNEAININKEEYGYKRIEENLNASKSLKSLLQNIEESVNDFSSGEEQFDDITLLSIRINKDILLLKANNPTYEIIEEFTDKTLSFLLDYDTSKCQKVGIIIDEILNNIISYNNTKTKCKMSLQINKDNDIVTLIFKDNGKLFNPLLKTSSKAIENIEKGVVGGYGISIVKNLATDCEYYNLNDNNCLIIKL